jgi:hypothetical protein
LALGPRWLEIGNDAMANLYSILRIGTPHLEKVSKELGIGKHLAKHLRWLLWMSDRMINRRTRGLEKVGGIFDFSYSDVPRELKWKKWSQEIWDDLANAPGFLRAVYLALQFFETKSESKEKELIDYLEGDCRRLASLPPFIKSYFQHEVLGTWGNFSRAAPPLRAHIRGKTGGRFEQVSIVDKPPYNSVDWKPLLSDWPYFAWHLLFVYPEARYAPAFTDFSGSLEGAEAVAASIKKYPNIWVKGVASWTEEMGCADLEGRIRSALLDCATQTLPADEARLDMRRRTMVLSLPQEAAFLPHVVSSLSRNTGYTSEERSQSVTERFGRKVQASIPNAHVLSIIESSDHFSKRIRAAALVLWLAHPTRDKTTALPSPERFVEYYNPEDGPWLLSGVANALDDMIYKDAPWAMSVMSALVEAIRDDFATRISLDSEIQRWRQMARAPVQAANQPELWKGA